MYVYNVIPVHVHVWCVVCRQCLHSLVINNIDVPLCLPHDFDIYPEQKCYGLNKYFELKKTRGAAAPTRTTCSSSQLLVRVVVHQDHIMSVY